MALTYCCNLDDENGIRTTMTKRCGQKCSRSTAREAGDGTCVSPPYFVPQACGERAEKKEKHTYNICNLGYQGPHL